MTYSNTDKGDYVLPGDISTYPNGGLHGRYSNNADLASNTLALQLIHHPSRMESFGAASGPGEYADQQDTQIDSQANAPGAASSWWSCIWYGATWLRLDLGNYTFTLTLPSIANNFAVRAYIGQTQFGTDLLAGAGWPSTGGFSNTSGQVYTLTITAADLAGYLSYGRGTVIREGWYPIKIEYAVGGTSSVAPILTLTNSPGAYTDPGGTAITSGAQSTVVPASSLSTLGIVDQRFQGVAHFDMIQTTILQAYGYQAALEPYQLESGRFPGVLAPRIREGADYDTVLQPDDRPVAEPINSYSNLLDATDSNSSLQGNGAGFQSGTTGQLQADVYDATTLVNSLFDVQGWQDFSDASYSSLLAALLNSQLGLSLTPWQTIAADPSPGRTRLANLWPLPSSLWPMKWRAGDGLRVQARDINVDDTQPRQLLQVVRNFTPDGTTGVTVTLASGPAASNYPAYSNSRAKSPAKSLKKMLYSATRPQRNYQRQLVAITGNSQSATLTSGTTDSGFSIVPLLPSDQVVNARLYINNISAGTVNVLVGGTDETSTLGGPWGLYPFILNLNAVAAPDANGQMYVQLKNNSGSTITVRYQLVVDVKR